MKNYFLFKVRSECPECGEAMMLDGPVQSVRCIACQSDRSIEADFWKRMTAFRHDSQAKGHKLVSTTFGLMGSAPFYVRIGRQEPACQACNKTLDLGAVAPGLDGEIACTCGRTMPTFPAPEWLRQLDPKAVPVFNATRDGGEHGTAVTVSREDRPVSFGCPDCGANLKITLATPRILSCEYCGTDLYLPNTLWHALHPVKKRSAWYIGFD